METYKTNFDAIVESKYAERERLLKSRLENAFIIRSTSVADIAHRNLMAEQSAMKERINQFTAVTSLHFKAALTHAQIAFEHA